MAPFNRRSLRYHAPVLVQQQQPTFQVFTQPNPICNKQTKFSIFSSGLAFNCVGWGTSLPPAPLQSSIKEIKVTSQLVFSSLLCVIKPLVVAGGVIRWSSLLKKPLFTASLSLSLTHKDQWPRLQFSPPARRRAPAPKPQQSWSGQRTRIRIKD